MEVLEDLHYCSLCNNKQYPEFRSLDILWRENCLWTAVGKTIGKYLCSNIMTSFTNTQHRGLFTCRSVVGQILQGVPALQHVGLLLQVLPVNTSCISCSTRWWKIKLSPFSPLHPCFLLLSVAKGKKKKAATRVCGCHLLASLGVFKLPRTHLAWVHLSKKKKINM